MVAPAPLRLVALAALASVLAGCGAPSEELAATSEDALLGDIASMKANGDGTYEVTCKDGRVEASVTVARLQAGDVCNAAPVAAPVTSWRTAKHERYGRVLNVSSDERHALADLVDPSTLKRQLGCFDLETLQIVEVMAAISEYAEVVTHEGWSILPRVLDVPGSIAKGYSLEVHSIDGAPSVTFTRPPDAGEGHATLHRASFCADGASIEWTEQSGKAFRGITSGPSAGTFAPRTAPACASPKTSGSRLEARALPLRTDLVFEKREIRRCVAATCTALRTMPEKTDLVLFSRTGAWMLYRANGISYRTLVEGGGAAEELAFRVLDATSTGLDGRVLVKLGDGSMAVYDIEGGGLVKLEVPPGKHVSVKPHAMHHGIFGYAEDHYEYSYSQKRLLRTELLLLAPSGESVFLSLAPTVGDYTFAPPYWTPTRFGFVAGAQGRARVVL